MSNPGKRETSFRHRLLRKFTPDALLALTAAGLAVRLTARDAFGWSAPLFYITPWPLLLLAWPVLGWWRRGRPSAGPLTVIGFGVTLTAWLLRPVPPVVRFAGAPGPLVKAMFWNIGHRAALPVQLHQLTDTHQPDILMVAEAENIGADERAAFLLRHPDYQIQPLKGNLQVAVRGQVSVKRRFRPPTGTRAHLLSLQLKNQTEPWTLMIADLSPFPLTPRTERVERIRQLAGDSPRTLIAGDFNTPYDSCAFDTWREVYHHGLSQAVSTPGAATWPIGLPLLALDHIWMSRDLIPMKAWKGTPLGHDHAWQIISIAETGL